jgi:hypothetical protein
VKLLAGDGQPDAVAMAFKERKTQAILETMDLATER